MEFVKSAEIAPLLWGGVEIVVLKVRTYQYDLVSREEGRSWMVSASTTLN